MEVVSILLPDSLIMTPGNLTIINDYYNELSAEVMAGLDPGAIKGKLIEKADELIEPNIKEYIENNL